MSLRYKTMQFFYAFVLLLCSSTVKVWAVDEELPLSTLGATQVKSLNGDKFSIPEDLPKETKLILVVGFSKDSKEPMKKWSQALRAVITSNSTKTSIGPVFNISILSGAPGFLRGFIIKQIKKDVPESAYDRFLVATKDSNYWKKLTQYNKKQHTYVVVLSLDNHKVKKGIYSSNVMLIASGDFSNERLDKIKEVLLEN